MGKDREYDKSKTFSDIREEWERSIGTLQKGRKDTLKIK